MWVWVDRLGGVLLDAALATTVLLSLVALAMLGCRQPARRVRLARAGILSAVVLLPLSIGFPLPRLNLFPLLQGSALQAHPFLEPEVPDPAASVAGRSSIVGPSGKFPSRSWLARVLTLGYLAGAGFGLAGLALGSGGLAWLLRHSAPPSPAAIAVYESLPYQGGRARPRLRVSERMRRPVLVGTFRQTILIPAALDRAEDEDSLRLSLLHELAHSENADPWFTPAGNLAQALWFFLPPLWWVRAQLRLDQEFLADRRAALGLGPLTSYAATLLGMAAPQSVATVPAVSGEARAGMPGSALVQRVLMLVHCPFAVESRPPAWWTWTMSSLVALTAIALSSVGCGISDRPLNPPAPQQDSSAPRTFAMGWLVVPEQPANSHGRSPLFELPIRLPSWFDLTVEVWGDSSTLPMTRVVGHRLGSPRKAEPLTESSLRWHLVRLQRGPSGITLTCDDLPVATDPDLDITTTWLSVEPAPGTPGRFRKLVLRW